VSRGEGRGKEAIFWGKLEGYVGGGVDGVGVGLGGVSRERV
jgi:hypothetical protein